MHGTIQFDGSISDPFKITCSVKQGCVLAPTLFGIFFSLLQQAFGISTEEAYLHTRMTCNLFKLARLKVRQRSDHSSSVTCCLLTIQYWQHTPRNICKPYLCLESTISNNPSFSSKISSRVDKAVSTFGKLTVRVWDNKKIIK